MSHLLPVLGTCFALAAQPALSRDLMDMSLEELMQVEITSVSRKSQKITDAAAAVFVITQDDIRRSGVTSIAEALRLAPGLQVAQIDSNKWAISSRGFNGRFANKLLVLMDGRSVYSPTFSGVYWEVQDTLLEDIERIEVIRGPGAAMWGSNAVNGVINIITKQASQTTGSSLQAGAGTYEKRFGSFRYGTNLNESTSGRVYVKGFHRGELDGTDQVGSKDSWDSIRGGFRVDHENDEGGSATLQGDIYTGTLGQRLNLPVPSLDTMKFLTSKTPVSGANLLGRWKQALGTSSELSLQAYYDHTYRNDPFLTEERDTFDLDGQHHFLWDAAHDIVWGFAYRWSRDAYSNRYPVVIDASHSYRQLFSGFVQDEITLIQHRLKFALGARLEHNDYTGFEGQPNFRLTWTPDTKQTIWAAVSKAVRIPSRIEDSGLLGAFVIPPNTPPIYAPFSINFQATGNKHFRSESLWAYELGYRFIPNKAFSVDLAAFYNDYQHLRTAEGPIFVAGTGRVLTPLENRMTGNAYGAEASLEWRPAEWCRHQLNYTFMAMDLATASGSTDLSPDAIPGNSPQHQISLRSDFAINHDVDFDLWLRYVDRLPSSGYADPNPLLSRPIPAYLTLDARLAWRPVESLELSLVGKNLLDPRHPEQFQEILAPQITELPRSAYVAMNWTF
jgi:iron complex outermembrane receptor protein